MSYKRNEFKEELIRNKGVTTGLPLFESAKDPTAGRRMTEVRLPDWIWDGSSIKAEIYSQMKEKFAEDALEYLRVVISLGGKASDNDVKEYLNNDKWPLHIVAARRNDLKPLGIIESYPDKWKLGPHGKKNIIWYVNFKNLYKLINEIPGQARKNERKEWYD